MSHTLTRRFSAPSSHLHRLRRLSLLPPRWRGSAHRLGRQVSLSTLESHSREPAPSREWSPPPPEGPDAGVGEGPRHGRTGFRPEGRPSSRVLRIADEISSLTLLEAIDLSLVLKRKLRLPDAVVQACRGGAQQPAPAAAGPPHPPARCTFDLKLEKYEPGSKSKVLNQVRAIASLGLKEARGFMENLPAVLKTGVSKQEAERIVISLRALGATVTVE